MRDYSQATKTNLEEFDGQEKYLLQSRQQIVAVLKDLSRRTPFITAYFNGGKRYLLTTVLAVLPERELVVLDYGQDDATNARALEEGDLLCVTKMDNINIKFRVSGLRKARFKGEEVFAADLPDSLYRPQRREFFRVVTPMINPLLCEVDDSPLGPLALSVSDLSVGGVGLIDDNLGHSYEIGTVLEECRIELAEFGTIKVDLEIRNAFVQTRKDGSEHQRIGCRYLTLSHDDNSKVQRYLHKLQIAQRRD